MAVWDPSYQRRWTTNVVEEAVAAGWDGVLADNDLTTLRYYSSAVLRGTGWQAQTSQLAGPGLALAVTRAASSDRRTLLYGLGSALARAGTPTYWTPSTTPSGDYTAPEWFAEMSWPTGTASGPPNGSHRARGRGPSSARSSPSTRRWVA